MVSNLHLILNNVEHMPPPAHNSEYSVNKMIGKQFIISGMTIEIVSDHGDRWETRNITTKETVFMDKSVLQIAIKLGKAEVVSQQDEHE